MKRDRYRTSAIYCLVALFVVSSTVPPEILAGGWPFGKSHPPTTIDHLAKKIDQVQRRLDDFGTIVAKSPDVWGESRLLAHRAEFEKVMEQDKDGFEATLQGAESTRDSALFASALSVAGGLKTTPAATESESNTQIFVTADKLVPTSGEINSNDNNLLVRSGPGPKFTNQFTSATADKLNISLEPTVFLDQKKRYLDHLHALRRMNEGDDVADSPGYALNLIRIPVSVMPGRKTRKGYGAQVSITVDPYASDELLPEAFRNFVINGVVDRIAPNVTRFVNDKDKIKELKTWWDAYNPRTNSPAQAGAEETSSSELTTNKYTTVEAELTARRLLASQYRAAEDTVRKSDRKVAIEHLGSAQFFNTKLAYPPSLDEAVSGTSLIPIILSTFHHLQLGGSDIHLEDVRRYLNLELQASYDILSNPSKKQPIKVRPTIGNPTELPAIELPDSLTTRFDDPMVNQLRDAIVEIRNLPSGTSFVRPNTHKLSALRAIYYKNMKQRFPGAAYTTTEHLGWHILVESVMLNERLIQDMKSVAANKNCCNAPVDGLSFYGPNPSIDARYAFKEYISCRWPIQVFALDPVTDDQNIGEAFSQRRELQLALAVAASQGIFGMQSLTRFVRRMEYDLETIQLNRTSVGFSHGNDTFGWRFYPRVQVPPVPGSIKAFGETLIGGMSREKRLKEAMLEPATRECSALVVMPSFIPYVMVDVQTNWFKLAPGFKGKVFKRKMDLSDAVEFSRDVTTLRQLAGACKKDAHLYRDGESHRLQRAVRQLERQLPLQTSYVQIPYENNLSGFQLFNNGVTDLGPELIDWYGGPGILVEAPAAAPTDAVAAAAAAAKEILASEVGPTTLFLVGKNFTSLGTKTKVIAGGIDVSGTVKFVSRSVIQVTIPSNVLVEDDYVDVHLATPYGVTSHLPIPAHSRSAAKDAKVAALEAGLKKVTENVENVMQILPIQAAWKTTTLTGCVDLPIVDDSSLQLSGGAKIEISANNLPASADTVLLIAKIEHSADGTTFVPLKSKASSKQSYLKYDLKIEKRKTSSGGKTTAECNVLVDDLKHDLLNAFYNGNHIPNDIKAIKLTGRVQLHVKGTVQSFPVYLVNKNLTIKMDRCPECIQCPPAAAADGDVPAPPPETSELFSPPPQPLPLPRIANPKAAAKAPGLFRSSMTTPPASRPLRQLVPVRHQRLATPGFTALK